jgi:hypothetical protein
MAWQGWEKAIQGTLKSVLLAARHVLLLDHVD